MIARWPQAVPDVSLSSPDRLHIRVRVSTDEQRESAVGPVAPRRAIVARSTVETMRCCLAVKTYTCWIRVLYGQR
jgi:hypothetical protein